MLKVHTDECETDSGLASVQEFIWQLKLYPKPSSLTTDTKNGARLFIHAHFSAFPN